MFINYWFILFASVFFPVYWFCAFPAVRKGWLLLACVVFHYQFAGSAGVIPIAILGMLTYFAGRLPYRSFRIAIIVVCVLELAFYKYSAFFLGELFSLLHLTLTDTPRFLPQAPPLAISFFVFEFVHYLVDVQKGKPPIRSPMDFTLFSIFWPSVVSGPVKRFEQFLPAVMAGCRHVNRLDIQAGTLRIAIGLVKKVVIADNLSVYIQFWQPQYDTLPIEHRWLIVAAISLRILFDFSGYSDMAIGFARLMGITLPENFRWPYLATNLQVFWQRWHISLSSWIRDYIYIPLGGSRQGAMRRIGNGILAFAICGLWHGAAWNFMFWGIYHGLGLVIFTQFKSFCEKRTYLTETTVLTQSVGWLITLLYVSVGWLYFFYPLGEATTMLLLLIKP